MQRVRDTFASLMLEAARLLVSAEVSFRPTSRSCSAMLQSPGRRATLGRAVGITAALDHFGNSRATLGDLWQIDEFVMKAATWNSVPQRTAAPWNKRRGCCSGMHAYQLSQVSACWCSCKSAANQYGVLWSRLWAYVDATVYALHTYRCVAAHRISE